MNYKRYGRKWSWPDLKYTPTGTDENHDNLSQDCRSPGRDAYLGPSCYGEKSLPIRPRRLVSNIKTKSTKLEFLDEK
jgi:hypothetical protein